MPDLFDLAFVGPFYESYSRPTPPPREQRRAGSRDTAAASALVSPERSARCLETLTRLRWGEHPRCPSCGSGRIKERPLTPRHGNLACLDCKRQFSARTGTIMDGSTLDLPRWFVLIALALRPASAQPPIGARRAARILGTNVYTTQRMWRQIQTATGEQAALFRAIADRCKITVDVPPPVTQPQASLTASFAA